MTQSNANFYLEALLTGDEKVILKIYKEMLPMVTSFVINNKGTKEDAQEVFHKVLCQLIARVKYRKFDLIHSFEGYLFAACKNVWRKELNSRKNRVRNDNILELVSVERLDATSILEQERWELFEDKIASLSDNCRALLELYFRKLSYKTIVEKLGYANENTAFQRVFKCKKRLTDLVTLDKRFKGLC